MGVLSHLKAVSWVQEKNDKLIEDIKKLFNEMDRRGTGLLSYEEYSAAVAANEVIQTKPTILYRLVA